MISSRITTKEGEFNVCVRSFCFPKYAVCMNVYSQWYVEVCVVSAPALLLSVLEAQMCISIGVQIQCRPLFVCTFPITASAFYKNSSIITSLCLIFYLKKQIFLDTSNQKCIFQLCR